MTNNETSKKEKNEVCNPSTHLNYTICQKSVEPEGDLPKSFFESTVQLLDGGLDTVYEDGYYRTSTHVYTPTIQAMTTTPAWVSSIEMSYLAKGSDYVINGSVITIYKEPSTVAIHNIIVYPKYETLTSIKTSDCRCRVESNKAAHGKVLNIIDVTDHSEIKLFFTNITTNDKTTVVLKFKNYED